MIQRQEFRSNNKPDKRLFRGYTKYIRRYYKRKVKIKE